jgi:hypothetical protein
MEFRAMNSLDQEYHILHAHLTDLFIHSELIPGQFYYWDRGHAAMAISAMP